MAEILDPQRHIDNQGNYLHFNHNSRHWRDKSPDKKAYVARAMGMGYSLETAQKAYKYFEPEAVSYASH
jgi:hypothetical protein